MDKIQFGSADIWIPFCSFLICIFKFVPTAFILSILFKSKERRRKELVVPPTWRHTRAPRCARITRYGCTRTCAARAPARERRKRKRLLCLPCACARARTHVTCCTLCCARARLPVPRSATRARRRLPVRRGVITRFCTFRLLRFAFFTPRCAARLITHACA